VGLKADLESEVGTIFRSRWTERDGTVVPDDTSVTLGNDAVKLTATVLYADLADSTEMVDSKLPAYSAEVYKTFLHCGAKIIKSERGAVSAYDGDRVMAVFIGKSKNTSAVRAAMKLRYAVNEIINPAKDKQYASAAEEPVKFVVGIDTSSLFIAKTGVRGANDLVWVGRAANYAAKLSALPSTYVYITKEIFGNMHESVKTTEGRAMWEAVRWDSFDDRVIYRSNWWWPFS
jgi:class 3 adenylate cyclase